MDGEEKCCLLQMSEAGWKTWNVTRVGSWAHMMLESPWRNSGEITSYSLWVSTSPGEQDICLISNQQHTMTIWGSDIITFNKLTHFSNSEHLCVWKRLLKFSSDKYSIFCHFPEVFFFTICHVCNWSRGGGKQNLSIGFFNQVGIINEFWAKES